MTQRYAVVAEFKNEGPIIMETTDAGSNYDAARARMEQLMKDGRVVRVAIARLVYETGNEALLPKEQPL